MPEASRFSYSRAAPCGSLHSRPSALASRSALLQSAPASARHLGKGSDKAAHEVSCQRVFNWHHGVAFYLLQSGFGHLIACTA